MPPAASSTGAEAIELAASAGLFLDRWQQEAVIDLLGEDDRGQWAATTGGLICPRQNGKGSIIEALELAWLFLCDVELIFHSAHLFATSADAYRRIRSLIQDTPDLDRQVLRYTEAHGQEGIELRTGQRLRFVTRSKSGGRGFPAPVVVLDEAFNLSKQAMAALVPTMAAQRNPFLLLTSSAPINDSCSNELRTFMRRSRSGEVPRRCYIEYSGRRGDDPETQLRDANPGYQIRLNDDVIAEERELLSPEDYEIERLGIVDLDDHTPDSVLPGWSSAENPRSGPTTRCAFALDANPLLTEVSIVVASPSGLGGTHIEVTSDEDGQVDHGLGPGRAVQRAKLLQKRWGGKVAIAKGSPAAALQTDLESAGVDVEVVSIEDHAKACGGLVTALNERLLWHLGQPELDDAVAGATQKPHGDAWLWDRRRSNAQIQPIVAAGLAKWALENTQTATAGFVDLDDFIDE